MESASTEIVVTEFNAYEFSDNFAIVSKDGQSFYGVEHNHEEADAIARYLSNSCSRLVVVRKNTKDQVRAAKAIRGDAQNVQVKQRQLILERTGIWKEQKHGDA